MIPSAFVVPGSFPLTPHGKLDRKALPAPEGSPSPAVPDFAPPRTPLEEEVARAWREVLGVDRAGVNDSYRDLGGHSLLATRVLSRILRSGSPPLQALFASPTLGSFAAAVGERALAAAGGEDVAAVLAAELNGLTEDEIRAPIAQEAQGSRRWDE